MVRAFLLAACAVAVSSAVSAQETGLAALEAYRDHVERSYAYLTPEKTARLNAVLDGAQPETAADTVRVLENAAAALADHHAILGVNLADSHALVPSGADIWAFWRGDRLIVEDVRQGSPASGPVLPGVEITGISGRPVKDAIAAFYGTPFGALDPEARDYAARVLLAGRRDRPRQFAIEGEPVELPVYSGESHRAPLSLTATPDRYAHIRFHDSLGRTETIAAFDAALKEARGAPGLIIDLRDTPSGGNSLVARGVLGRFVKAETPYQRHELVEEKRAHGIKRSWVEYVSPRGERWTAPVVVLVSRWTGSMGEGLAIGFDATGAGTVIGTEMAGLQGAIYDFDLPGGITVKLPAERLFHVDGTPREDFAPPVLLERSEGKAGLEAAQTWLDEKIMAGSE